MDNNEFEILVEWCEIKVNSDEVVTFTPYLDEDKETIDNILEKNGLIDVPLVRFQEITDKCCRQYGERLKIKQKKLEEYLKLSPEQVAKLPFEDKVSYVELLFPHIQMKDKFIQVCKDNEDSIRSLMFNMNFPKSFWDKEKQQADRYMALVAGSDDIMKVVKNWEKSSVDDKKQVVLKSAEIFGYVYGSAPEIVFFTPEEERKKMREKGQDENQHIYAAYYSQEDKKIHFNIERLQNSDNFFALSVMLHEGTHYRQNTETFENPLMDRLFHSHINRVRKYGEYLGEELSDFYVMQPDETHAHALQDYLEKNFPERTGIEKKQVAPLDEKVRNAHNKAFTMARISQYKSSR